MRERRERMSKEGKRREDKTRQNKIQTRQGQRIVEEGVYGSRLIV